jgi:Na+:H+ antiporter, NhaA family
MAERLEKSLHPWVSFMILPLFALANAGVALSVSELGAAVRSSSAIGIFLGLVVGKIVGVGGFSFLAVKFRLATIAEDTNRHHFIGAGMLAGIGFTVALFVSTLAFESDELESAAKIAILIASLVSGVLGYSYLRLTYRQRETKGQPAPWSRKGQRLPAKLRSAGRRIRVFPRSSRESIFSPGYRLLLRPHEAAARPWW